MSLSWRYVIIPYVISIIVAFCLDCILRNTFDSQCTSQTLVRNVRRECLIQRDISLSLQTSVSNVNQSSFFVGNSYRMLSVMFTGFWLQDVISSLEASHFRSDRWPSCRKGAGYAKVFCHKDPNNCPWAGGRNISFSEEQCGECCLGILRLTCGK
jgi:hypothetical protein